MTGPVTAKPPYGLTIFLSAAVTSLTLLGIFAGISGDWRMLKEQGKTIPDMRKLLDTQQAMLITQSQQNTELVQELRHLRDRLDVTIKEMKSSDLLMADMREWVDARIAEKVPPPQVTMRLAALEATAISTNQQVQANSIMLAKIATKVGVQ